MCLCIHCGKPVQPWTRKNQTVKKCCKKCNKKYLKKHAKRIRAGWKNGTIKRTKNVTGKPHILSDEYIINRFIQVTDYVTIKNNQRIFAKSHRMTARTYRIWIKKFFPNMIRHRCRA